MDRLEDSWPTNEYDIKHDIFEHSEKSKAREEVFGIIDSQFQVNAVSLNLHGHALF